MNQGKWGEQRGGITEQGMARAGLFQGRHVGMGHRTKDCGDGWVEAGGHKALGSHRNKVTGPRDELRLTVRLMGEANGCHRSNR